MKSIKLLLLVMLFFFTTLAFPWGSELCQGCRLDSSALAGPIYTFPNSQLFQQMISTNGTFLFQDAIDRLPAYSNGIKLEIRTQDKAQLRLAYDVNNYVDFRVSSGGTLTINAAEVEVNGNIIANAPIASHHVATKAYVDASTAGNAQETSLTDMKGAGFTSANAGLSVIRNVLGTNDADNVFNSSSVVANSVGSILERLESLKTVLASLGSPVKLVQRGNYTGAGGTVTITAVNTSKSVVLTVSKGSAGTVAATGTLSGSASLSPAGGMTAYHEYGGYSSGSNNSFPSYSGSISGTLSGGTTSLTTKQYSGVLTNSTTLTFDGPCEWQVIEYN